MYRRPFHNSSKNWMSLFSSSRFAVYKIKPYKNTTDNKLINTFSWLKNSVHVEPIWFSLDNLALCGRCNYTSMVLHAISKKKFQMRWSFSPTNGTIFLLFSSKIETSCQQNKQSSDKLEIPCGTKFLRVLIFAIFAILPAIREINAKIFPQNLLQNKSYSD